MHSLEHLRELFRYNDWANRRFIVALRENHLDRGLRILGHVLTTEKEYFERLYGKDSTGLNFWPELEIADCSTLAQENGQRFDRLLRGFDESGLDIVARYNTSEGVRHENTVRELLTHVAMHSATHRGNIIIAIRDAGIDPPKTDYIIYLRENKYI